MKIIILVPISGTKFNNIRKVLSVCLHTVNTEEILDAGGVMDPI